MELKYISFQKSSWIKTKNKTLSFFYSINSFPLLEWNYRDYSRRADGTYEYKSIDHFRGYISDNSCYHYFN